MSTLASVQVLHSSHRKHIFEVKPGKLEVLYEMSSFIATR